MSPLHTIWLVLALAASTVAPAQEPEAAPPAAVVTDAAPQAAPATTDAAPTGAVPAAPAAAPADDPMAADGPGIPGLDPGPPPAAPEVDEIARRIGLGLRCPVCQGLSVADSTSNAAVLMQRRIRELVAQGYTKQDIEDYFVSRYGEFVLLEPRGAAMTWLVWLGPLLAAGLGVLIASTFLSGADGAPPPPRPTSADPYVDRLMREVDDE